MKIDHNTLKITYLFKYLYFFVFGSTGIFYPYIPVFFETIGKSKFEIGILCSLPNATNFFFAPIWTYFADTCNTHNEVLMYSYFISTILTFLIQYFQSFFVLFILVLIVSIFKSPTIPLIDSAAISSLGNLAIIILFILTII
jgi:PPP family 3-phenylpropionic acid transporter